MRLNESRNSTAVRSNRLWAEPSIQKSLQFRCACEQVRGAKAARIAEAQFARATIERETQMQMVRVRQLARGNRKLPGHTKVE